MAELTWDAAADRQYETGVSKGVLFPLDSDDHTYGPGVAWNGLTQVSEKPDGADPNPQYADNIKYLNLLSAETYGMTIEAFTYPDEFGECDGTSEPQPGVKVGQQNRKTFGFCYRTEIGNGDSAEAGYLLHLVYGCLAAPSEKDYATINDSPAAVGFSWDVSTTPEPVTGLKPTALITINSLTAGSENLSALEEILYGTEGVDPELPLPDAVIALFDGEATGVLTVAPSFNPTGHVLTIPSVTGVIYYMDGDVIASGTHTIAEDKLVTAEPAAGYYFNGLSVKAWHIVYS